MSKSLGNAIYLSDSPDEITKKVKGMYTDPGHLRVEDPGKVEGNVVFTYLDIFDEKKDEVADLKSQYTKGGLGDVVIKKRLAKVLQDLIAPIRTKRESLAKDPDFAMNILKEGTARVQAVAKQTIREVKEAIKIDYF